MKGRQHVALTGNIIIKVETGSTFTLVIVNRFR
jgi:hypothetical protein